MGKIISSDGRAMPASEARALELLGAGCTVEQAAMAAGISVSRISQLMATDAFSTEVAEKRFERLNKHNEQDDRYDTLEKKLTKNLEDVLPLIQRPMELLKAVQVINGLKRKGASSPDNVVNQQTVVNLTLPTMIVQKFTTNINNQVIHAGDQTLETMQSSLLLDSAKKKQQEALNGPQLQHTEYHSS